jgi:putative addiction module antidote
MEFPMIKLTLTPVGTSTGVVLPSELLAHLKVKLGDVLYAVETPEGGCLLTPHDPEKLEKAEDIMKRYRNTLNELAK